MGPALALALLVFPPCLPAGRAAAAEDGVPVTFSGLRADFELRVENHAPGEVLWESEAGDPAGEDFPTILLEGRSPGAEIDFQASEQDSNGEWGPWYQADLERFPSGRFWGRIGLGGAKGALLKFRAIHRNSSASGAAAELYGLELGPNRSEREASIAAAPAAPQTDPPESLGVQPRSAWGAEPPDEPYEPMTPVRISIHHTAGFQAMTRQQAVEELRAIQHFHKRGRGWIDIAYHFLIDGEGRIWRGRPETMVGSHVAGLNPGNVGISLMGDFQKSYPTKAQYRSLVLLTQWLVRTYGIDPKNILGHRDQNQTPCPGTHVYVKLPELRKEAAAPAVASAVPPSLP
jgi:hypothetical protein